MSKMTRFQERKMCQFGRKKPKQNQTKNTPKFGLSCKSDASLFFLQKRLAHIFCKNLIA